MVNERGGIFFQLFYFLCIYVYIYAFFLIETRKTPSSRVSCYATKHKTMYKRTNDDRVPFFGSAELTAQQAGGLSLRSLYFDTVCTGTQQAAQQQRQHQPPGPLDVEESRPRSDWPTVFLPLVTDTYIMMMMTTAYSRFAIIRTSRRRFESWNQ